MADLGRAALIVSFGLALWALVAGIAGAKANRRLLVDSARNALIAEMLGKGMRWTAIQAATKCSRATIAKVAKSGIAEPSGDM